MAVAVDVAKAAVAWIEAHRTDLLASTAQEFTLDRSYADWDLELKEIDKLELREADKLFVDVVTHTTQQDTSLATRGSIMFVTPVDIAVRRKFGPDKIDDDTGRIKLEYVDALMALVEELHVLFTKQRLVQGSDLFVWDNEHGGTQIVVGPLRQHLRELQQFTGIIRIYFRTDKALT